MDTRYGVDESGLTKQTGGKSDDVDIGFAKPFGGTEIPAGYLYCDGSEVSRKAYDKLFAAIGTTWGEGDGENTFNIPDLRGIFIRCDGGENNADIGVRQEDAIRNITGSFTLNGTAGGHPISYAQNDAGAFSNADYYASYINAALAGSGNSAGNKKLFDASRVVPTAPEVRPINVAMKYCIRYE